jgi:predicted acetyltransferase
VFMDAQVRELRLPELADGYDGKLRRVRLPAGLQEFAKVYEQVRPERIGWSSRDESWWRYLFADHDSRREGATAYQAVVHDTPHGPTGYAIWRAKEDWDDHGPNGRTQVREVVAADPQTYLALWRFLFSIDLTRRATASYLALDEPLMHLVDEPRRLGRGLGDALWVRMVDVPRALAARRYATDIDLVLDVTDALLPANSGRWRLTGGPSTASCTRTEDPADLACTVLELGSVYLGGVSPAALAAAGRIREVTPGALATASAAFGWSRQPNPTETF